MSVTIAVATFDPATGMHLAQVDDALRELKQYGKTLPGSVVVTERRRAAASGDATPAAAAEGAPDPGYGLPPKIAHDDPVELTPPPRQAA
jgi:hypothetical protein